MIQTAVQQSFNDFVMEVEPGLRRALAGHLPTEVVPDALAEAFTHAWQHWERVRGMQCPGGYLFRVAQSKTRPRRAGLLPGPDPARLPDVEPGLGDAMRALAPRQRSVVWLVHGCDWTYAETAEALGISASAVGTHLGRGLARLRTHLGVTNDD